MNVDNAASRADLREAHDGSELFRRDSSQAVRRHAYGRTRQSTYGFPTRFDDARDIQAEMLGVHEAFGVVADGPLDEVIEKGGAGAAGAAAWSKFSARSRGAGRPL